MMIGMMAQIELLGAGAEAPGPGGGILVMHEHENSGTRVACQMRSHPLGCVDQAGFVGPFHRGAERLEPLQCLRARWPGVQVGQEHLVRPPRLRRDIVFQDPGVTARQVDLGGHIDLRGIAGVGHRPLDRWERGSRAFEQRVETPRSKNVPGRGWISVDRLDERHDLPQCTLGIARGDGVIEGCSQCFQRIGHVEKIAPHSAKTQKT